MSSYIPANSENTILPELGLRDLLEYRVKNRVVTRHVKAVEQSENMGHEEL
jgi:hypothetical protein